MIYSVKQLCYTYPHQEQSAFQAVSFTVEEGEVMVILGPNGAGKSTLLNCLTNLLKPTSGTVLLGGAPIQSLTPRQIAAVVGYVRQNHTPVFAYPVLNFVMMGRAHGVGLFGRPKQKDMDAAMEALEALHIAHLAHKPYTELSGGERQQVVIARTIAQRPKVILLDEPTSHLDFGNQQRILELVQTLSAMGYAVIMTTHDPNHAILLEGKTAILDQEGFLQVGLCQDMLTEERLNALYQTKLRLAYVPMAERNAVLGQKLKLR